MYYMYIIYLSAIIFLYLSIILFISCSLCGGVRHAPTGSRLQERLQVRERGRQRSHRQSQEGIGWIDRWTDC